MSKCNAEKVENFTFDKLFTGVDVQAVDLMKKLLTYDPKHRLSAEEALEHPFFAELHDVHDEPRATPISYFDFEFEQYSLDKQILKDLILDEVLLYQSSRARQYYELCKQHYPKGVLEIIYKRSESSIDSTSEDSTGSEEQDTSPKMRMPYIEQIPRCKVPTRAPPIWFKNNPSKLFRNSRSRDVSLF